MKSARRPALAAALLCLAACGGPADAALQFHGALRRADGDRVMELLSERSRQALESAAKTASEASGGALPADPARMVTKGDRLGFYYGPKQEHPVEVRTLEAGESEAKVEVKVADSKSTLRLVKEHGRWVIDLDLPTPAGP